MDVDEDMDSEPPTPRLSSPISSRVPSSTPTPFLGRTRHGRTTPPPSPSSPQIQTLPSSPRVRREQTTPSLIQREHTTPLPSPRAQLEPTIPAPSTHIPRINATPSSSRTTPSSPRSELNQDLLPPPHKRIRLLPAPFRQGYTPGPKPKAADYDDGVEKMLLNAMHEYSCLILTADAFPNEAKQTQWAEAMWHVACKDVGVHYECSVRMIRLVSLQHYCHSVLELNVDVA